MTNMKVLDLFAGAGGFTVAGEISGGYETVAFCEIDKYAQKVLAKNWPHVPIFDDVTKFKGSDIGTVDLITGGFPCQDLSSAGAGAGIGEGTRSGLFREMLRLATETGHPYIIFENVSRLLSGPTENPGEWFGEFLWAMAEIGYDAEWFCITASSLGAPHERERVCVVAYPHASAVRWHHTLHKNSGSQISELGSNYCPQDVAYPNKALIERGAYPAEYTRNTPSLTAQIAGGANGVVVNPRFVEWMMGYPKDHTALD